jgi:SagB-type dehydrogenase family enzyme
MEERMTESIGREFMRKTCYEEMGPSDQEKGMPQPPLELAYPPQSSLLSLPSPQGIHVPALDLRTAIERRVSIRSYADTLLTMEELSFLLWCTQGVKRVTDRPATLRTVPSAGARHPFETFLLLNRVEGVAPGVYRYIALEHALLEVNLSAGLAEQLVKDCHHQRMVGSNAVTFFWTAVLERTAWRYNQRAYRYIHLDAGHVCQNLYLAAEALDCGMCAIAAFDDHALNTTLGLDGESMFVVYAASLGKKI